jgi:hypothetical protein
VVGLWSTSRKNMQKIGITSKNYYTFIGIIIFIVIIFIDK